MPSSVLHDTGVLGSQVVGGKGEQFEEMSLLLVQIGVLALKQTGLY